MAHGVPPSIGPRSTIVPSTVAPQLIVDGDIGPMHISIVPSTVAPQLIVDGDIEPMHIFDQDK